MDRTVINPFSQGAHEHRLSDANQTTEYLCKACHTLGSGSSKRCNICRFDLHGYCATCPDEISAPKLHPFHSMQLIFQRAAPAASGSPMRVCDVCGDEVDGLYYHCAVCDLDIHPLCQHMPLCIRDWAPHPEHELKFDRYHGDTSTCMVCRKPCQFWWYRCIQSSCAAGKVDVHPECLLRATDGEAANGSRSLRPRPQEQQQPQPHQGGYPTAGQPPSAPHFPSGDNRRQDFYHSQQQHYYPAPPPLHHQHQWEPQQPYYTHQPYDPYLHRVNSCPPVYAHQHTQPPYPLHHSHSAHGYTFGHHSQPTPHMHMPYGHHPAASAFGNPHPWQSQSEDGHPGADQQTADSPHPEEPTHRWQSRRRIYALVANVLLTGVSALTFGMLGVPSIIG